MEKIIINSSIFCLFAFVCFFLNLWRECANITPFLGFVQSIDGSIIILQLATIILMLAMTYLLSVGNGLVGISELAPRIAQDQQLVAETRIYGLDSVLRIVHNNCLEDQFNSQNSVLLFDTIIYNVNKGIDYYFLAIDISKENKSKLDEVFLNLGLTRNSNFTFLSLPGYVVGNMFIVRKMFNYTFYFTKYSGSAAYFTFDSLGKPEKKFEKSLRPRYISFRVGILEAVNVIANLKRNLSDSNLIVERNASPRILNLLTTSHFTGKSPRLIAPREVKSNRASELAVNFLKTNPLQLVGSKSDLNALLGTLDEY